MRIAVVTLFPEMLAAVTGSGVTRRAVERGLLAVEAHNPRDHARDVHRTVDDRPFGGGPGMVLKPEPIFEAVEDTERRHGRCHRILLCPRGRAFAQADAAALAGRERILMLCGRYEGFDERIRQGIAWDDEISIGDYVLAGGELPALVVLESAVRLVPGVLGCAESPVVESFQQQDLLDYPQYTRPRSYRGMAVPEVLLSGDHQAVARWRQQQAEALTAARRARATGQNDEESQQRL